jgi:tetratricopeptide (TPR) repeat protein
MRPPIVTALAILVLVGSAAADDLGAGSVAGLLAQADAARDAGRLEAQLDAARLAFAQAPEDAEVLVHMARAHVDLGNATQGEARARHYEDAAGFAHRAADLAPNYARAHLWVAISVGKLALTKGGRAKLAFGREIRREAERALEIDPDEADALLVLARWHYSVATLSWWERAAAAAFGGLPPASLDEAERLLERAISLEPAESIRHRLMLARVQIAAGRPEAARRELETLLELPATDPDDPGRKDEARALLANL